jgi:hypothetical protein
MTLEQHWPGPSDKDLPSLEIYGFLFGEPSGDSAAMALVMNAAT